MIMRRNSLCLLGGTFDRFHVGHEHLLTTCLEKSETVQVWLISDEIAQKKTPLVLSWDVRKNEIMGPEVGDLEKKQLFKLAEYFSKQTWPRIPFKGDPKRVSNGERAANSGQCVACHLGSYTGNSRIQR